MLGDRPGQLVLISAAKPSRAVGVCLSSMEMFSVPYGVFPF